MKRNRAFTLIELLVVISIISLLSSVVMASLNTARSKARDTRRLADIKQIQVALTAYHSDNGTYPSTSNNWYATCGSYGSHPLTGASGYIPNLAPTYMSVLPADPKPTANGCGYLYRSTGTDFMFLVYGTVEGTPVPSVWLRPSYPSEKDYALYTPGASSW